jgi:hypothetical protein
MTNVKELKLAHAALYALCAGLLTLGGCDGYAGSPSNPKTGLSLPPDAGLVRIVFAKPDVAREVLPDLTGFAKYALDFVCEDGIEEETLVLDGQSPSVELALKAGNWTVVGSGWVNADVPCEAGGEGEDEERGEFADLVKTAEGSAAVEIRAGEVSSVSLALDKRLDGTEGEGTLVWDVAFPADKAESATLTLSRLDGAEGFVFYKSISLSGGPDPGRHQGGETLSAGYYRIDVALGAADAAAGRTYVVYIYARLETSLPPIVWTAEGIPSPPPPPESGTGSVDVAVDVRETEEMEVSFQPPLSQDGGATLAADGTSGHAARLDVCATGFASVLCMLDGVEMAEAGGVGCFVVKAADLSPGNHFLTVIGINGAVVRSREIPVVVVSASSSAVVATDSAAALAAALTELPMNTPETAYDVVLTDFKISSNSTNGNTLRTMFDALSRYVALDLRGCTGSLFANCSAASVPNKKFVVSVRGGEGLVGINLNAFTGCTALVRASFPAVGAIDANAFSACSALQEITLGAVPPSLGPTALPSGPAFTAIRVPADAVQTYLNTDEDGWSTTLKALVRER